MPDVSLGLNPRLSIERMTASIEAAGGGPLFDYIAGTPGDDHLLGTNDDDTMEGFGGHDVMLGRGGNDNVSGADGNDFLRGDPGNDGLFGGDGDDYLRGGAGNDTMNGQGGFDRAAFYDSLVGVHVSLLLAAPQDTGQGVDWLIDIDHLSGTTFDDKLTGNAGDNWLWGAVSAAEPPTGGGNDTLIGDAGDDLLDVGSGNHRLIGGAGIDTVTLFGNLTGTFGGVSVDLNLQGAVQDTGQGLMFLKQIEQLSGSDHDDELIGDSLANLLAGRDGDDTLTGGAGRDQLFGDGAIAVESPQGTSGPIVELRQVIAAPDSPAGADLLFGGGGADFLLGGFGADDQTGGSGADIFMFQAIEDSLPGSTDIIRDFTMHDQVDVKSIDADASTLANEDFHWVAAFTGSAAEAQLQYNRSEGLTHLALDVDGDAVADAKIVFEGFVSTFYDFNGIV